jgi:formylglycine-generating enzyme required for sulfatase activity
MQHLRISTFSILLLGTCSKFGAAQSALEMVTDTIPGTEVYFSMVRLPGGTFMIGTPEGEEGRDSDEGPQREVAISSFYIGVHEVTYDEFVLFSSRDRDSPVSAPGVDFDPDLVARPSPPYEDPAHGMGTNGYPAVGMTQWSALQYARWLSEKTGIFYRLPTEAEWEYACRAGSSSRFSFGASSDSLDTYAWHYGNSNETYQRVGQKTANPWGIFDMHGNVAEWTLDEYSTTFFEELTDSLANDPWQLPTRLHPRTVRGGAYDDNPDALRCGARLRSDLDWKRRDPQIPRSMWWNTDSPFVGFRIVRPFVQPTADEQIEFWMSALGG